MPNILVVDDSPTMRRMVMAALRPLEASFGEAGNGLEAIEQLSLRAYDAMTLDINMPDMHGLEVIRFVRGVEAYARLPILVLTTRQEEGMERTVLEAGANLFATKPFTPDQLLAKMKELLA